MTLPAPNVVSMVLACALLACSTAATPPSGPLATLSPVCVNLPVTDEREMGVQVDPSDPKSLWAFLGPGGGLPGIFVSSDGGEHFRVLNDGQRRLTSFRATFAGPGIAIVEDTVPGHLDVPARKRLLFVVDHGASVLPVKFLPDSSENMPEGFASAAIDDTRSVGTSVDGRLYRSDDAGAHWKALDGRGLGSDAPGSTSYIRSRGARLYRVQDGKLAVSDDNGATFTDRRIRWALASGDFLEPPVEEVALGPGTSGMLVAAQQLLRSDDDFATFRPAVTTADVNLADEFSRAIPGSVDPIQVMPATGVAVDGNDTVWVQAVFLRGQAQEAGTAVLRGADFGAKWTPYALTVDGQAVKDGAVELFGMAGGGVAFMPRGTSATVERRSGRLCSVNGDATGAGGTPPLTFAPTEPTPGTYDIWARFTGAADDTDVRPLPAHHAYRTSGFVEGDLGSPVVQATRPALSSWTNDLSLYRQGGSLLVLLAPPPGQPGAAFRVATVSKLESGGQVSTPSEITRTNPEGVTTRLDQVDKFVEDVEGRMYVNSISGLYPWPCERGCSHFPRNALPIGRLNGVHHQYIAPVRAGADWLLTIGDWTQPISLCSPRTVCQELPFVPNDVNDSNYTNALAPRMAVTSNGMLYVLDRVRGRLMRRPAARNDPFEEVVTGLLAPSDIWIDLLDELPGVFVLDGDLYRYVPPATPGAPLRRTH